MSLPSPIAQWPEPPSSGVAVTITPSYWHYDSGLDKWTLTDVRALQSGELVDVLSTGVYTVVTTGTAPGAPRLLAARAGTTTHLY